MKCIICKLENTHRNQKVVWCVNCFHVYRDYGKMDLESYYTEDYRSKIVKNKPANFLLQKRNYEKLNLLNKYLKKDNSFLEVGFGRGHFYKAFKEKFHKEKYYCCEINKNLSEEAREQGINVFSGAFQKMKTNLLFDVVASFDVLEHFQDPHDYKQKLLQVLKPEGVAIIQVPVERRLHSEIPFDGHYHYFSDISLQVLLGNEFQCENIIVTKPGQVANGKEMIGIFKRIK